MSQSQNQLDFKDAATKFKGSEGEFHSTYFRLFKFFSRGSNDVPKNVADDDLSFIRMTISTVTSTHVNNDIKQTPKNLNNLVADIEGDLTRLEQLSQRTANKDRHKPFLPDFNSYKTDLEKLETERKELTQKLNDYLQNMNSNFEKVVEAIEQKKSPEEVTTMFTQLRKERELLTQRINEIEKKEDGLQLKLQNLQTKTQASLSALAAAGIVSYPQIQPKTPEA